MVGVSFVPNNALVLVDRVMSGLSAPSGLTLGCGPRMFRLGGDPRDPRRRLSMDLKPLDECIGQCLLKKFIFGKLAENLSRQDDLQAIFSARVDIFCHRIRGRFRRKRVFQQPRDLALIETPEYRSNDYSEKVPKPRRVHSRPRPMSLEHRARHLLATRMFPHVPRPAPQIGDASRKLNVFLQRP